jgi:competence protein ComGC
MRTSKKQSFTIVDVLVGLAVLLVLSGLFIPYFVKPSSSAAAAPSTHVSAPK